MDVVALANEEEALLSAVRFGARRSRAERKPDRRRHTLVSCRKQTEKLDRRLFLHMVPRTCMQ